MALSEYLASTRDHYASYHHHKEQMAYAAATLYLATITAIALNPSGIWVPPVSKTFLVKLVLLMSGVAYSFVVWQLRNRAFAADMVAACNDLLSESASGPGLESQGPTVTYENRQLPPVLAERVRSIVTARQYLEGPLISEAITYLVMFVWMIGGLVRAGSAT